MSNLSKRLDRLHRIHQMIRTGGWTQEAMALEFGITVRTVRSDFEILRARGAPLRNGGRNGWTYTSEWRLEL